MPTITVTVVNPGASPQEIETEITDKVEGAVNTISGIDELRSTSVEGVSQVFITFLLEKNPDIAAQEVRNKIDLIVNDLPVTAEQPIVQKLDTDAAPVVRIAVSAPRSLREVTDVADKKIKQQIESINGVGQVQIIGGRTARDSGLGRSRQAARLQRHGCRSGRMPCARKTWKCPAAALTKARAS